MTKSDYLNLAVFVIGLSIILYFFSYASSKDFYIDMLKDRVERSYSGVVARKYIDKHEHSTPMLEFRDSSVISIENCFWDNIKIGDSIVKKMGSATINVYRNGNLSKKLDYKQHIDNLIKMHVH